VYDAVWTIAYGFQKMQDLGYQIVPQEISNCLNSSQAWEAGPIFWNILDIYTDFVGASGIVEFDTNGDGFGSYDVINFQNSSFLPIGLFNEGVLQMSTTVKPLYYGGSTQKPLDMFGLQGRVARVLVLPSPPFVNYDDTKEGNARYTGLSIDLFQKIVNDWEAMYNWTITYEFFGITKERKTKLFFGSFG